ncbi:hypothetical protein [Hymenobacter perfusus]|uniref:Uncharacterized protein n=1 Tax=Hymenobacter perfusus TaxID=1236770 RepID=A0A3R9P183_9BACT|nr:hypothetical protein [Hymenobacter perfusus]RSK46437.1 hypothetical protein EI293_04540 [Hymenobacter perfusus]
MRKLLSLLCLSLLVWALLLGLLLGKMALQATLDIQLHNTFVVVGSYAGQLWLLVLVVLLVLAANSLKQRARESKLLLGLLAGSGLLLEVLLLNSFMDTGFTVYPPLSPGPATSVDPLANVRWIFWGLQGFLLLVVLWASVRLLLLTRRPPSA